MKGGEGKMEKFIQLKIYKNKKNGQRTIVLPKKKFGDVKIVEVRGVKW